MFISAEEVQAHSASTAIQAGDTESLATLLAANPDLATAYIGNPSEARTLLHIATDWPGNFPHVASTINTLVAAGADPNAPFVGPLHKETPLHWAASCDDVPALDALLNAGADIEAPGGVIAGGTPLTDAVAFRQWRAANRLVERGAKPTLRSAAGLGLLGHLQNGVGGGEKPSQEELDHAFWYACHGGQLEAAQYLHEQGADSHVRPPWSKGGTALDAARENLGPGEEATDSDLVNWLRSIGVEGTSQ